EQRITRKETRRSTGSNQTSMNQLFRKTIRSTTDRGQYSWCLWLTTMTLLAGIFLLSGSVSAQTRDHLTDQETELVRFHQELDKRTEVFIKAIDRRFAISNGTAQPAAKKSVKDDEEGGDFPKRTRGELMGDS